MLPLVVALLALAGAASAARPSRYNTAAARRDEPGITNVHIIAHTHDDVGWLKTVDEYYAGLNNSIQHASVRHILESTVDSLVSNPDRKFIYVEQAFFQRFFAERTDDEKAVVRELVAEGRLSFVNGGWSMHDEATTSYVDMVDNTCLGHRYIASEFGVEALPSVTWQIDPFGHSSTQQSLLSSPAAGFSSLFVSRADYADIRARTKALSLEYVWQSSASLGPEASTFFSIMNQGLHLYFPLPGLCWDIVNCNDPEIQDDPTLDDYNVDDVVRRNVEQARLQQSAYVGDIYYTMGFDFNFEYAEEWFGKCTNSMRRDTPSARNVGGRARFCCARTYLSSSTVTTPPQLTWTSSSTTRTWALARMASTCSTRRRRPTRARSWPTRSRGRSRRPPTATASPTPTARTATGRAS